MPLSFLYQKYAHGLHWPCSCRNNWRASENERLARGEMIEETLGRCKPYRRDIVPLVYCSILWESDIKGGMVLLYAMRGM